jgi:hypothetical protein
MKMYIVIALSLLSLAASAKEATIDLTEGKIQAVENNMRRELGQELDAKEVKALQLINFLGRMNNDRFSSDLEKGDSEDAYYAFLGRFQSLKEDKELSMNPKELRKSSEGFDILIRDLKKFIK